MALPRELPADQYEALVREYCMEQFVSKGMVADYAIHDKGDGNPHAHVMLTMRAMDEHGKWLPKARRVYILDENGERIKLPSGDYKTRKERTTDWDISSGSLLRSLPDTLPGLPGGNRHPIGYCTFTKSNSVTSFHSR